jgi:hypothetical protein
VSGFYHAFLSTLPKGDISTLAIRGHFYFGLTGRNFHLNPFFFYAKINWIYTQSDLGIIIEHCKPFLKNLVFFPIHQESKETYTLKAVPSSGKTACSSWWIISARPRG